MNAQKTRRPDGRAKTRILIVDDHPIFRQGLADLIGQEPDLTICGEAEDAVEAIKSIKTLSPDMAVVDISLKETSGLELIKDVKARWPDLPVLTLSMHDELLYAERALRAGAKGYIMKQEATERVISAIRKVLKGQIYVSETITARMVSKLVGRGREQDASGIDLLSDRELEVFRLIGQGYGTHEIADRLHLSTKTIETYRAHIKQKLNLSDAAALRQYAVQWVSSEGAL